MNLKAFSKVLHHANAWQLHALLETPDVPPADRRDQILLGHATGIAQLLERATDSGLRWI